MIVNYIRRNASIRKSFKYVMIMPTFLKAQKVNSARQSVQCKINSEQDNSIVLFVMMEVGTSRSFPFISELLKKRDDITRSPSTQKQKANKVPTMSNMEKRSDSRRCDRERSAEYPDAFHCTL